MAGMIESIFGKTTSQLAEERNIRNKELTQQFADLAAKTKSSPAGAAIGAGFGTSFAQGLLGGLGLDPEIEKAKQAEEQQAALNERTRGMRSNDPRYYMALSDAYSSTGNTEAAAEYAQIAARYEELAERRRQQYRDQEMKDANELAEALDDKDLSDATLALAKDPNDENAIRTIAEISGDNAPNVFYAADRLRENMQGQDGITKRQANITDKFVSDLSNGLVSPVEVYGNYKSIYGDDFIVPESFLDQFNTDEKKTNDNGGNGGNPPTEGTGDEVGVDNRIILGAGKINRF